MSTMLQRFQEQAIILKDPKLFKAKLCIMMEDIPKQYIRGMVQEFFMKINSIVAEEGEDNFITRMYPGGLKIIPYPIFHEKGMFISLKELKKMLDKEETIYTNTRTFLQNTKIIMAKVETRDWSSLDNNFFQTRVSTLKRLLKTAIHIGVEENNPKIVALKNHDTGIIIDEPAVVLSEIFEELDNPTELFSDENILLFEENTNFVRLSDDAGGHVCGKPCRLENKCNCQKVCAKEIGHEDNEHMCQLKRHYCGKPCSLSTSTKKGNYQCPNKCIVSCEERHDVHRCENETCPVQCPISGQEHQCPELCEKPGICKILTEPQRQETEQGVIRKIMYTQLSERMMCCKKIPPNEFRHKGMHSHSHDNDDFHYCDAKCQFCEYYCTLPYGHEQPLHETNHGIMIKTKFISEYNFVHEGRRLQMKNGNTLFLCNLYCKGKGGHRHIDYCKLVDTCEQIKNHSDIKHINEKVKPNSHIAKDLISHRLFWERTGFKDPYSVQEKKEFAKCGHECSVEDDYTIC
ncbi:14855_t:CDS:10 [Acaulospora morrowiae]|uniref:14855_t:CDS:1 n=1 Tax=Acaulospora morrowiae TaxID=94023 RepID=A0A9N9FIN6_9GLOM|nr:14855_t:CDS:10 [Acaulospora morrowiae]